MSMLLLLGIPPKLIFLSQEKDCFGLGFRALSPLFFVLFFIRNGATNEFFISHERRGNMVCCCLGSMLV